MIPDLLYLALDFYREPRRFDRLRNPLAPLPFGITDLLSAPANCLSEEHIAATAGRLGATEEDCQACVPFFIKQVLLEPDGDYYRTLGLSREAEQAQVKEHYFYLMRLFHPDKDITNEGWDELFAPRINEAYNTLRNSAKRADYDQSVPLPQDMVSRQELGGIAGAMKPPPGNSARPARVATTGLPQFLRSPWSYGGLVGLSFVVFWGLLSSTDGGPELKITEPVPEDTQRKAGSYRSLAEVRLELQAEEKPQVESAAAQPGVKPSYAQSELASDSRIEDMVAARVAQATTAVLGAPKPAKVAAAPRSAPKPAPASEASKPQAAVVQLPQPREEPAPKPQPELNRQVKTREEPVRQVEAEPVRDTVPAKAEERTPVVVVQQAVPEPLPPMAQEPAIAPQVLEDQQLMALLGDFAAHYRAGDARAFAGLFTEDAQTTDASGRAAIESLYSTFFAANRVDSVNFRNVSWNPAAGKVRTGRSVVYIATAPHGGGEGSLVEAAISFEIRLGADKKARIARMSY